MNEELAAAFAIYGLGVLSGIALVALLQCRARSRSTSSPGSVSLRLRAVRRSRVAVIEQRLDAVERAVASVPSSAERRGRPQKSARPIADPDALEALLSLGYRR